MTLTTGVLSPARPIGLPVESSHDRRAMQESAPYAEPVSLDRHATYIVAAFIAGAAR